MKIKLVIWDLDQTLWSGTLAEGEEVRLLTQRAETIRALNRHGVVSSICSKNDAAAAREKLVAFGLWDQFVFARFAFAPKAQIIQQIISDMHLRAENVLFIDDDIHNLEEARFLLPALNVVDALSPACDALLADIVAQNRHVAKSRVEEYRLLERRLADQTAQSSSNEEFLRSCDIHVALVHRTDNMEFSARIEELINRSNQLNYTKSRVAEGSMFDLMATGAANYGFSVFVWDKYGYHGLVGFASLAYCVTLTHFVFSCRIMNMGIESWLLHRIKEILPSMAPTPHIPVEARAVDWIHEEKFYDPAIRAMIWQKEKEKAATDIALRVMAKCQSGALAHYSGFGNVSDPDGSWGNFSLHLFLNEDYKKQRFPGHLVYAATVDYDENEWAAVNASDRYAECVEKFCAFVEAHNKKLLVILTPQDTPPEKQDHRRRTDQARMKFCNDIWRKMAALHKAVSVIEVADIAVGNEVLDNFHYDVPLLKKLGDRIGRWFEQENEASL